MRLELPARPLAGRGGVKEDRMPLIQALVALVAIGLIVYLVETYIPMAEPFRTVFRVLVVLLLILWLLQFIVPLARPILHAQTLTVTATAPTGLQAAYAMSNATDASGNGRTATLQGTTTVPGQYAEAQHFAGTAGSRMTIPSFNLGTAFTLEGWVYLDVNSAATVAAPRNAPGGWQALIYKGYDNVFLVEVGGFVMAGFTPVGATQAVSIVSPTKMLAGGFHHVAASYDGATFILVIDGVQVASTKATGAVAASPQPIEVGGSAVDLGYLVGVVDDVRIYSRGLTVSEIASDLATPVETATDPVASWTLEVFPKGSTETALGAPVATGSFPKSGALCNQAPSTPPTVTVRNPTRARVADPEIKGRECELVIETFILGVPIAAGYQSTATAIGMTGTKSGRSALSNAFDRVAIVNPPGPPVPAPVVK